MMVITEEYKDHRYLGFTVCAFPTVMIFLDFRVILSLLYSGLSSKVSDI